MLDFHRLWNCTMMILKVENIDLTLSCLPSWTMTKYNASSTSDEQQWSSFHGQVHPNSPILSPFFLADETPKNALSCSSIFMIHFTTRAHQHASANSAYLWFPRSSMWHGKVLGQYGCLHKPICCGDGRTGATYTILMQWAMYQFGCMTHIANLHDLAKTYHK